MEHETKQCHRCKQERPIHEYRIAKGKRLATCNACEQIRANLKSQGQKLSETWPLMPEILKPQYWTFINHERHR